MVTKNETIYKGNAVSSESAPSTITLKRKLGLLHLRCDWAKNEKASLVYCYKTHSYNALHDANKRICLMSNCHEYKYSINRKNDSITAVNFKHKIFKIVDFISFFGENFFVENINIGQCFYNLLHSLIINTSTRDYY